MRGSARCVECGVLTADAEVILGWYYCDDHAPAARKQRGILANSKAMMGNQNARKRSGNPAVRAATTEQERTDG